METNVDLGSRSLTWKFYSTPDGRTVKVESTGPQNIVPAPAPSFIENPDLKPGGMKQTDYAANGADVDITRTVVKDGGILFQDEFKTHYQAWQAVCEFAPGLPDPQGTAQRESLCQRPHSSCTDKQAGA